MKQEAPEEGLSLAFFRDRRRGSIYKIDKPVGTVYETRLVDEFERTTYFKTVIVQLPDGYVCGVECHPETHEPYPEALANAMTRWRPNIFLRDGRYWRTGLELPVDRWRDILDDQYIRSVVLENGAPAYVECDRNGVVFPEALGLAKRVMA